VRSVFELSERRACRIIGCVGMAVRYSSRKPTDTKLRERLRALAQKRRSFGDRRLHVLLQREGFLVNHKRLFRPANRSICSGARRRDRVCFTRCCCMDLSPILVVGETRCTPERRLR
jgi:putative transposase